MTDTNMAKAGINKKTLARLGGQVHCFMADEAVAKEAKKRGVTRAGCQHGDRRQDCPDLSFLL